jgi:formylglycine-generating enzyme required for sulfatase activity
MAQIPESDPAEFLKETRLNVPTFRIDRTEVTNAAFEVFAKMSSTTRIARPVYPDTPELKDAGSPRKPVAGLNWIEARAYCRFLGKELPSSQQWTRALRGRIASNPQPHKNFPWGTTTDPAPAKLKGTNPPGTAEVMSFPLDKTEEGVFDLAGNIQEWTSTILEVHAMRAVRGGNWDHSNLADLPDFMAIENPRLLDTRDYAYGVRCASSSL